MGETDLYVNRWREEMNGGGWMVMIKKNFMYQCWTYKGTRIDGAESASL